MTYRATIATAYDAGVAEEYNRLIESPQKEAEFQLTKELLDAYIPKGAAVIDIGSGPGRYAEYLLNRQCKVGVVDLSAKSLKAFSDRMKNSCCQQNIIFNQVSCATQLNWIADNSTDAILLMGPLYHLINDEHRDTALAHCHRILRPGGYLFSIFLSPFPLLNKVNSLQEILPQLPNQEIYNPIKSSIVTHTHFQGLNVPQYRCWPEHAKILMKNGGFDYLRIRNLDGIESDGLGEAVEINKKQPETMKNAVEILRESCDNTELQGRAHQFLYVGKCNKLIEQQNNL